MRHARGLLGLLCLGGCLLQGCQHTPFLWVEVGGSCRGERLLLEAQIVRLQERIDELKHLVQDREGKR